MLLSWDPEKCDRERTERRGRSVPGESSTRTLRVCCVGDGKETQPDGEQGEAAAIPAGLIFRQSSPLVPRAPMSTAERQCFLNQTSDVMGRVLQGDKRPESRGKDGDILPYGAHSVNLITKTQRTTVRTELERMSDSEKVARRYRQDVGA